MTAGTHVGWIHADRWYTGEITGETFVDDRGILWAVVRLDRECGDYISPKTQSPQITKPAGSEVAVVYGHLYNLDRIRAQRVGVPT